MGRAGSETQQDDDAAVAVTRHGIATGVSGDEPRTAATEVFRVVHRDRADAPFASSENRSGGRWTSPGIPAAYASSTPAGAVLEFLVHMEDIRTDLVLVRARMPARALALPDTLPAQWRDLPYRDEVRAFGDAWIASHQSLALSLPSVLCEQSRNLLINPEHADAAQLVIDSVEPFTLDRRLIQATEEDKA